MERQRTKKKYLATIEEICSPTTARMASNTESLLRASGTPLALPQRAFQAPATEAAAQQGDPCQTNTVGSNVREGGVAGWPGVVYSFVGSPPCSFLLLILAPSVEPCSPCPFVSSQASQQNS